MSLLKYGFNTILWFAFFEVEAEEKGEGFTSAQATGEPNPGPWAAASFLKRQTFRLHHLGASALPLTRFK